MPGLIGLIEFRKPYIPLSSTINRMVELLMHEDYYTVYKVVDRDIGIGAIDLGKGDFISRILEDDSYIVGFTGQVYDQEVLREKVSYEGGEPIDLLDILLSLYRMYGPEGLCGMNGLYIVVIWDKREKRLHIVNDRYGFKKLYYWNGGNKFVFASEYKAICWFPDFRKNIDELAFSNLVTFGYILEDRTLFEDIKLLPPASIVNVDDNAFSIRKYWDYSFYEEGEPRLSEDEYIDGFAEKITNAVRKRVQGIDRLAIPLSGGLDSRTVASVLHKLNMVDYTKAYSFGHRHCHDVRFGKQIAKKLEFPHETEKIMPDFIKKHSKSFQYLCEGMAACDWAWRIDIQNKIFQRDKINTVISGFLGDVLCRLYMSWEGLLGISNDENAIRQIFKIHIDSFNDEEAARYLNKNIYLRIQGYNFEILKKTYYSVPTNNILNKARYVNLHQRQRRFTSTLLDHYEFFANALSPFVDIEFVDFILHVPAELEVKQSLYKKMLIRHFPEVVRIRCSGTRLPVRPSWWQEGLNWRKERYKNFFKKLSFGRYGSHNYKDYRHTEKALRTASREFMLNTFENNAQLKSAFFDREKFDQLVDEFLYSSTSNYEKVCYPLTFFVWSDIFLREKFLSESLFRHCLSHFNTGLSSKPHIKSYISFCR